MIEIIIIALLTVWAVFAVRSLKMHKGCCDDCTKCEALCNRKPPVV